MSPKVEKARIDKSRSDHVKTTPLGNEATLNCVYIGNPPPKVHWTKDGKKLDTNCKYCVQKVENVDGVSALRVTPYRDIDFGDYKCRARNRLGFGDITIKLQEDKTKSKFCVMQSLQRNRFRACIFFLIPIISAKEYNVFLPLKMGSSHFWRENPWRRGQMAGACGHGGCVKHQQENSRSTLTSRLAFSMAMLLWNKS